MRSIPLVTGDAERAFGFTMPLSTEEENILTEAIKERATKTYTGNRVVKMNPAFVRFLVEAIQYPEIHAHTYLIDMDYLFAERFSLFAHLDRFRDCLRREVDLNAEELAQRYRALGAAEHPIYGRGSWRMQAYRDLDREDDIIGYWTWVKQHIEITTAGLDSPAT